MGVDGGPNNNAHRVRHQEHRKRPPSFVGLLAPWFTFGVIWVRVSLAEAPARLSYWAKSSQRGTHSERELGLTFFWR